MNDVTREVNKTVKIGQQKSGKNKKNKNAVEKRKRPARTLFAQRHQREPLPPPPLPISSHAHAPVNFRLLPRLNLPFPRNPNRHLAPSRSGRAPRHPRLRAGVRCAWAAAENRRWPRRRRPRGTRSPSPSAAAVRCAAPVVILR